MHIKSIFPLISSFHSSFCALSSLHSFDDFPWFSPLSLISYPLKKTKIGILPGEDIIYLRLLFKSHKIPGFELYTEKQSNTSTGNHPTLWEDRPVQTACSTYPPGKAVKSEGNAGIACRVALERVLTPVQKNRLYFLGGMECLRTIKWFPTLKTRMILLPEKSNLNLRKYIFSTLRVLINVTGSFGSTWKQTL